MRRYGFRAGKPGGLAEKPRQCIVNVEDKTRGWPPYQCLRKRGHGPDGLYCAKHAKMLAEGKHLSVPEDK